ncbi:MAG: glycosyltransferase family 1 protein [Spirochaetales bacterium]|nr:MAG: glycosyltransferase family 1 protein [Spirochaetales bacterium]
MNKIKKNRQRIAFISTHGYVAANPPLGAPDTGGQVVFVLELAKKLGQAGFYVDLWTRQFEDQEQEEAVAENVRILRVPCGGEKFIPKEYLYKFIPEWVQNAVKFIRKNKLAYNFINSHYWDAGLAGDLLSTELSITHLHTPHSLGIWKKDQMEADYSEDSGSFDRKYNFSVRIRKEREIYNNCSCVIATTPLQFEKLNRDYDIPESKLVMIPPGYDDNRFYEVGAQSREMIRKKLGFEGKVIYTVSRLAANKGLDLLIHGFSILAEREKTARLVLAVGHENRNAGEEALYRELENLRKSYGLEDRISFTGYISDDDLPDYYRASDVFVLPSRYEPFGMTVIEAMACGTPTVITIHGGLYKIFEFGFHTMFTDPFDKEDLGITLLKTLRYPSLRKRLKHKAAQLVRSTFTWTGIAQQLINTAEFRGSESLFLHVRRDD